MEIRHILFDLDGTLLPMIQEKFVRFYMPLLAKTYISRGGGAGAKRFYRFGVERIRGDGKK